MPNPLPVQIIAGQWNKITGGVPDGVKTGQVYMRDTTKKYFWTYRVVSLAEPDPVNFEEGKIMFLDGPYMEIGPVASEIHVFVWVYGDEDGVIEAMI